MPRATKTGEPRFQDLNLNEVPPIAAARLRTCEGKWRHEGVERRQQTDAIASPTLPLIPFLHRHYTAEGNPASNAADGRVCDLV